MGIEENSELFSMLNSGGDSSVDPGYMSTQGEIIGANKKKRITDQILAALQGSLVSPPPAITNGMSGQNQAANDAAMGRAIGGAIKAIGSKFFATGGDLYLTGNQGDEDTSLFDPDDVQGMAGLEPDDIRGGSYTQHMRIPGYTEDDDDTKTDIDSFNSDPLGYNQHDFGIGQAGVVGEAGPELVANEGNKISVTPINGRHSQRLMQVIEQLSNRKDAKPGIGARIGAALLGAAGGYLQSSPHASTREAGARMAPMLFQTEQKILDAGNTKAKNALLQQVTLHEKGAALENADMRYQAQRAHEQRLFNNQQRQLEVAMDTNKTRKEIAAENAKLAREKEKERTARWIAEGSQSRRYNGTDGTHALETVRIQNADGSYSTTSMDTLIAKKQTPKVTSIRSTENGLVAVDRDTGVASPILTQDGKQVKPPARSGARPTDPSITAARKATIDGAALFGRVMSELPPNASHADKLAMISKATESPEAKAHAIQMLGKRPSAEAQAEGIAKALETAQKLRSQQGQGQSQGQPGVKVGTPTPR